MNNKGYQAKIRDLQGEVLLWRRTAEGFRDEATHALSYLEGGVYLILAALATAIVVEGVLLYLVLGGVQVSQRFLLALSVFSFLVTVVGLLLASSFLFIMRMAFSDLGAGKKRANKTETASVNGKRSPA